MTEYKEWKAESYFDWLKHQFSEIKANWDEIKQIATVVLVAVGMITATGVGCASGMLFWLLFVKNLFLSIIIEVIGVALVAFMWSYFFYYIDKDSVTFTPLVESSPTVDSYNQSGE